MITWFLPNYKPYANRIVEWNKIADGGMINDSPAKLELQENLIQEEWYEVMYAYDKQNKREFLKELCDLFVVTSYYVFLAYPDDYEFSPTMFVPLHSNTLYLSLRDIGDAVHIKDYRTVLQRTITLLNAIHADSERALTKVIDNNYSKFTQYHEDNELSYGEEAIQIESTSFGRYQGVTWEVINGWVIFKDMNGKILKPVDYQKVELQDCLIN